RFSNTRLTFDGPDNQLAFDGSSAPPNGQFRTSLGRLTLIDSRAGDAIADFRPFINSGPNTDRFNFNPFEDLLQNSRRLTLFGNGQWYAGDTLTLHAEAFYHRRDSSQQLAPLPFFTTRLANVMVSADNAFNVFDERIADVRRRLVEAGPRRFIQDNQAWRVVLGADGRIGQWYWDAAINHGRNETDQRQTGDLLADRVRRALGPSFIDAGGQARCGRPDAPLDDCVPLNLFGPPGSITDAMLADIGADLDDSGFNEQTVFDANLSGDLLQLPAGMLALAAGVEWREERGADRPDPQSRAGNTTGAARAFTRGAFDAAEAYLELGVPLLADQALARRLDLDLGGRVVRFNNFGTESVFEVGLGWQPLERFSLRASWSEAFRAPNIGELFGGQAQANPIVLDPCADFGALSSIAIERCIAQGVPADGSFRQNGEETPELLGGNPGLKPERGEILTVGLGWL
ncbi:MAG: TonB-dependent receptor domain-containing protein, partial [Wenzhouxiangellaceae bacterium]